MPPQSGFDHAINDDLAMARPPARFVLAIVTILVMPFLVVLKGWGDPTLGSFYNTLIFPLDLAFAGLLLASVPSIVRLTKARGEGFGATGWSAMTLVLSLAWLVHPSVRGAVTLLELWGTAALAFTVTEMLGTELSSVILIAIGGVAVTETCWAGAQRIVGGSLGLHRLGESGHPLYRFGAALAPMGSLVHIYVLAGLSLVAGGVLAWQATRSARPAGWLVGAGAAIAPVGLTYSRAGAIGLTYLVAALALTALRPARSGPGRARLIAAATALLIGFAVPAAVWNDGWRARSAQTTQALQTQHAPGLPASSGTTPSAPSRGADLTTDRGRLINEAVTLLRAHLWTGVGPGRYILALRDRFHAEPDPRVGMFKPVHNVPLLVAAEGGLLAGVITVSLLVAVGCRALRSGGVALSLYLAYLPFILLDHFPYYYPQGLVVTALWLGVLDHLGRRSHHGGRRQTLEPRVA